MDSLNKKILIAFLALLILDLLVRLWASWGSTVPTGVEFLSFDPAQVSTVQVSWGEERLILQRASQGFEYSSRRIEEGRVNQQGRLSPQLVEEVEAFLKRVCSMAREPIEGIPDVNDTIYGLEPAQSVSVRLQFGSNEKTQKHVTIRFGAELPLNVMYVYAAFDDKPGVFKVLKTYRESAVTVLRGIRRAGA